MEALKQPSGAKSGPTHLIGDALSALFNANFIKFFNEFFIAKVLAGKLRFQEPPGAVLPFGVDDHFHTAFSE